MDKLESFKIEFFNIGFPKWNHEYLTYDPFLEITDGNTSIDLYKSSMVSKSSGLTPSETLKTYKISKALTRFPMVLIQHSKTSLPGLKRVINNLEEILSQNLNIYKERQTISD